jgi:putative transposase
MKKSKSLYRGHRFPAVVISCAVRWYFRYQLSLRDIEELLFERGVIVTYETIRCWCDIWRRLCSMGESGAPQAGRHMAS